MYKSYKKLLEYYYILSKLLSTKYMYIVDENLDNNNPSFCKIYIINLRS